MLYYKNIQTASIENETWNDIAGFEGVYQASNLGRIKSLGRKVRVKNNGVRSVRERIMKQTLNSGYLHVGLGRGTNFLVHILVAKAHISNPESKPTVNHKNGIKIDNRISELEWATRSEQMRHAYGLGLIVNHVGWKSNESHPSSIPVFCINNNTRYPCSEEAARQLRLQPSHIREVCASIRKTTGGFKFKYA